MTTEDIKLVAIDMDGTLLDSQKKMPEDFIPWVQSHPEIKTVIASGRQYYTLEHDMFPIKDSLIFIAENGGLVFEKGKTIYRNVMRKKDISDCLSLISQVPGATPILCGTNSAYLKEPDEQVKKGALIYYFRHNFVKDMLHIISEDQIVKIAVYFKDKSAEASIKYFSNVNASLDVVISGDSWIDISNSSVNKGNAIKAIQDKYGITPDQSMAFGDYFNDMEMLQNCTESYCMENGHPTVKATVKHIAQSNDDNGVMKVLNTL